MCYQESLNCGDCKTCLALQLAVCCCECRCGIPTDSVKTVPWIVNVLGLTMWYQFSMPCSCLSSIGELKELTAADEPWCDCCGVANAKDSTEASEGVVSAQPEASIDEESAPSAHPTQAEEKVD